MRKLNRRTWVGAAIALSAIGVIPAGAQAHPEESNCGPRTLQGRYIFSATGYTMPAGVALPKAIVEVIFFNGDGTLDVPAATRSVNGAVARSPAHGSGTYTLNADCSGTVSFTAGPNFDIFAAPRGQDLWMIQTDANNVFQGKAIKVW